LKKLLLASENSKILKKNISKFRKFGNTDFDARSIFFSKNKNFHENLPEAGRLRELDHKQYELKQFGQFISRFRQHLLSL
jgi:hypothetical protein